MTNNKCNNFDDFKALIENRTGFKCYEPISSLQQTWYGTSDYFEEFRNLAIQNKQFIQTGSIVCLLDTKENYMFTLYAKTWVGDTNSYEVDDSPTNNELELFSLGFRDITVIPDKYNTGVNNILMSDDEKTEITVLSNGDTLVCVSQTEGSPNVNVTMPAEGTTTLQTSFWSGWSNDTVYLIENKDLSIITLWKAVNQQKVENITFIFKNCILPSIAIANTTGNIHIEMYNCTVIQLPGAYIKARNIKVTGGTGNDGCNPIMNMDVNNIYFYDPLHGQSDGLHIDAIQAYGNKDVVCGEITFDNFRANMFDAISDHTGTSYVNSPLMVTSEQSLTTDGYVNTIFKNGILSGGNFHYITHNGHTHNNLVFKDLIYTARAGDNPKDTGDYPIYKDGDYSDYTLDNCVMDNSVFVSSVYKTNNKVYITYSNQSYTAQTMKVKTNLGEQIVNVSAVPINFKDDSSLQYSDYPFDKQLILEGNIEYVVCYLGDKQIRFVDFTDNHRYTNTSVAPIDLPTDKTWQLKTTDAKKYIVLSTDDDNQGNIAYFRLLKSYGFPYTMNVTAEVIESGRMLGTDNHESYGLTDDDGESLFPTSTDIVTFAKYLCQHPELGEVAQHGDSEYLLWDSDLLVGDKLTTIYSQYTSGGGTKSESEFKTALMTEYASSDVRQGASYVSDCKEIIENAINYPIYTLGIWGSTGVQIDGVTVGLSSVQSTDVDWKSMGYCATATSLYGIYQENTGNYDLWRHASFPTDLDSAIAQIPYGHYAEYFYHAPFIDAGVTALKEKLNTLKTMENNGTIEVVTRKQYYDLGEWVSNPIVSIDVTRNTIDLNDTDSLSEYTVTVTYADGTTGSPNNDVIIDNSAVNTSVVGNYPVTVYYRGFHKTINVSVVKSITLPTDVQNATDGYYITLDMDDDADHMYCLYVEEATGGFKQKSVKVAGKYSWYIYNTGTFSSYETTDGGTTWTKLVTGTCRGSLDSGSATWFGTSTFDQTSTFVESDCIHIEV